MHENSQKTCPLHIFWFEPIDKENPVPSSNKKEHSLTRFPWLTPVILATLEAEVRRIAV
jgi:hypothetical protein